MKTINVYCHILFNSFFGLRTVSGNSYTENQNTILFSVMLFYEIRAVYGIMWKPRCGQRGHRWRCNTAHVHCIL